MRAPTGDRRESRPIQITERNKPAGGFRVGYALTIPAPRALSVFGSARGAGFVWAPADPPLKDSGRRQRMKVPPGLKAVSLSLPLTLLGVGTAHANDDEDFEATLSGDQEVVVDDQGGLVPGGTNSPAFGRIDADFTAGYTVLAVDMIIANLGSAFAAAHFHCGRPGENGPIVFGMNNPGRLTFDGRRITGRLTNADYTGEDCTEIIGRPVNNLVSLAFAMRDGLIYANVHTDVFPQGEIRGQMLDDADDDDDDDPATGDEDGDDDDDNDGLDDDDD
jgi:hypothetical protein